MKEFIKIKKEKYKRRIESARSKTGTAKSKLIRKQKSRICRVTFQSNKDIPSKRPYIEHHEDLKICSIPYELNRRLTCREDSHISFQPNLTKNCSLRTLPKVFSETEI